MAPIADPVGLTDALTVTTTKTTADTGVGVTDSRNVDHVTSGTFRTLADPVGLTDAATVALTRVRAVADVAGLSDARAIARVVVAADAVGLTDVAARAGGGLSRSQGDTLGLTDALTVTTTQAVADAGVGLADTTSVAGTSTHSRTISDAVGVTHPATTVAFEESQTDPIGLTDTAGTLDIPTDAMWALWDGTTETPLTLAGQWDGTTIQPLTLDTVA